MSTTNALILFVLFLTASTLAVFIGAVLGAQ